MSQNRDQKLLKMMKKDEWFLLLDLIHHPDDISHEPSSIHLQSVSLSFSLLMTIITVSEPAISCNPFFHRSIHPSTSWPYILLLRPVSPASTQRIESRTGYHRHHRADRGNKGQRCRRIVHFGICCWYQRLVLFSSCNLWWVSQSVTASHPTCNSSYLWCQQQKCFLTSNFQSVLCPRHPFRMHASSCRHLLPLLHSWPLYCARTVFYFINNDYNRSWWSSSRWFTRMNHLPKEK